MTVSCELFNSLDQIPIDELITASIPKMDDGTIDWQSFKTIHPFIQVDTVEQKTEILKNITQTCLDNPNSFCVKIEVSGEVLLAIFGSRDPENSSVMLANISLGRPDKNGSRSYIYREDVRKSLHDCLENNGILQMIGYMPEKSSIKDSLSERNHLDKTSYQADKLPDDTRPYVHWKR